jgi:3-hydroxymyristoyl/3-hydroxydecanoyl-(acyl carrier protein) dehydratase
MVIPGDQLRLEVEWTRQKGKICQMKGQAFVGSDLAAEAEIYASVLGIEELKSPVTSPS